MIDIDKFSLTEYETKICKAYFIPHVDFSYDVFKEKLRKQQSDRVTS